MNTDPDILPSSPPDVLDEVDLPASEDPPNNDESDTTPREHVVFWPGHRIVLDGSVR